MPKSLKNETILAPPPLIDGTAGAVAWDTGALGMLNIAPTVRTMKSDNLNAFDVWTAEYRSGTPEGQTMHLRKVDRSRYPDAVMQVTQRSTGSSSVLHFATAHGFVPNETIEVSGVNNLPDGRYTTTAVTALTVTITTIGVATNTLAASGGTAASIVKTIGRSGYWENSNVVALGAKPQLGNGYSLELPMRCQYNNNTGGIVGLQTPITVTHRQRTSNIATLTTAVAHGFVVGQKVFVAIVNATYDSPLVYGGWKYSEVLSVPTATTFTYANTGANEALTAASAGACVTLPFLPGLTFSNSAVGTLAMTSDSFHKKAGISGRAEISYRAGSYAAPVLPFFVCSVTISALPEASTIGAIGQISAGYGFGLRVRDAGQFDFCAFEEGASVAVLAAPGATVAVGDTIHLAKFGNKWEGCITSGNIYGQPKSSSKFEWWKRSGTPGVGLADIFGESSMGILTNSESIRMNTPRFTAGG